MFNGFFGRHTPVLAIVTAVLCPGLAFAECSGLGCFIPSYSACFQGISARTLTPTARTSTIAMAGTEHYQCPLVLDFQQKKTLAASELMTDWGNHVSIADCCRLLSKAKDKFQ